MPAGPEHFPGGEFCRPPTAMPVLGHAARWASTGPSIPRVVAGESRDARPGDHGRRDCGGGSGQVLAGDVGDGPVRVGMAPPAQGHERGGARSRLLSGLTDRGLLWCFTRLDDSGGKLPGHSAFRNSAPDQQYASLTGDHGGSNDWTECGQELGGLVSAWRIAHDVLDRRRWFEDVDWAPQRFGHLDETTWGGSSPALRPPRAAVGAPAFAFGRDGRARREAVAADDAPSRVIGANRVGTGLQQGRSQRVSAVWEVAEAVRTARWHQARHLAHGQSADRAHRITELRLRFASAAGRAGFPAMASSRSMSVTVTRVSRRRSCDASTHGVSSRMV